jgi:hypothetical protein
MSEPTIVDELDGEPANYDLRPIGDSWRSPAHVLIVLAGDGSGPEYAVAHPTECDDECEVEFQLYEGGYKQPPGYPQVPTEPGLHLLWVEYVKGGWANGSYAIDHDAYLVFGQPKGKADYE